MPENKSKNKPPRPVDTDGAGSNPSAQQHDVPPQPVESESDERKEPFDLESVLAVGGPPVALPIVWNDFTSVPIVFEGVVYSVGRRYSAKTVRKFFKLLRTTGGDVGDEVLGIVLAEGDPKQLWADIGELSLYESNALFAAIYKIAGLMSLSGKFLAS
ncbi:hypothetical protein CH255_03630 [Rhodococcus sp. 05-2255-2A2]|uniref:hypothetical protein n=1 Tax=unclassified Rhodococcus (in: high G+C Gram-positive bacteria) TaxID=192944 RepID=UPI000B9B3FFF|nr:MULTISPECIES: hypothetical protein [unclassified Rhodococcus (in: high G+C Gram-positive bacteria)]OZE14594.1 hypothetical protein CH250_04880 [Rhodococcus sp. 05-2255-3C]OZE23823.1 hypothetical protein CH255_03630 [Rhodococcus sp. 05-2255-2A2]